MKRKLNLSLDEEIVVDLKELAKNDHKTVSQWVTDAVMQKLKEQSQQSSQSCLNNKKQNSYIKSPMNYIGGKFKLLPQIIPLFPQNIDTMMDLFCGGCDVVANVIATKKYANDINYFVIDIFKYFQSKDIDVLLNEIDSLIAQYDLSKTNKDGYLALREHYNNSDEKNPIELFTLVCYSFNYQFRFNSNHEYNNPFGKDRSCFSECMRKNLIKFWAEIKDVEYSSKNFKDIDLSLLKGNSFLYADPPYRITTGSYNDGKRGFEGWGLDDDLSLFVLLDEADKKGIKFAMSNVIRHKGIENSELIEWAKKYNVHYLNFDYSNSNYHSKNTDKETVEVLITNY